MPSSWSGVGVTPVGVSAESGPVHNLPGVLVELADIVKVDFRLTDRATRGQIVRAFRGRGIRLLAEKVETEVEFRQAHADGYELFQGYFFARPNVVSGRAIPAVKQNLLRLLHEAHRPDPNHRHFEEIIRQDMAIAFKLLTHLRGAAWGQRRPVDSVRNALLLLGDRGIRKWASIVAIATLGQDRPAELVVTSLVRASFCEGIMAEIVTGTRWERKASWSDCSRPSMRSSTCRCGRRSTAWRSTTP